MTVTWIGNPATPLSGLRKGEAAEEPADFALDWTGGGGSLKLVSDGHGYGSLSPEIVGSICLTVSGP